ncbi:uncharacterized protein BKA78DRAFT_306748 [Phyllosticta capitalensis]|uniref:uncharacterized protein n=1 Tax=Phyllosticta capitalensis TaxID=121624 RepID=UPI00312F9D26
MRMKRRGRRLTAQEACLSISKTRTTAVLFWAMSPHQGQFLRPRSQAPKMLPKKILVLTKRRKLVRLNPMPPAKSRLCPKWRTPLRITSQTLTVVNLAPSKKLLHLKSSAQSRRPTTTPPEPAEMLPDRSRLRLMSETPMSKGESLSLQSRIQLKPRIKPRSPWTRKRLATLRTRCRKRRAEGRPTRLTKIRKDF